MLGGVWRCRDELPVVGEGRSRAGFGRQRPEARLLAGLPPHRSLRALLFGGGLGCLWYRLKSSGPVGPLPWRGFAGLSSLGVTGRSC